MSGAMLYTQALGSRAENVEVPQIDTRNPTQNDLNYPIGKRWVNQASNQVFSLLSFSYSRLEKTANWISLSGFSIVAKGSATLTGGSVTIMNTAITSSSLVFLTYTFFSGSLGLVAVAPSSITNGQFIIQSSSGGDSSSFFYVVVNP